MGLMHDSLVRTTLVDNSIAIPTPDPIQTGFTFLQPFFAKRGRQNEIIRKGGIGAFEREYGNDVDNVTKYGHGGLIAKAVLQGGGIVDACRLMPDDATKSGLVISLILDENGTDPKITIHAGAVDSTKTTAVNLVKDDAFKLVAADTTTVKRYPIILLESTSTGSFGNSFTAKLSLDTTRDGKNPDGRRYVLDLADAGNRIGDKFEVISFSFNPDAKTTPSSEALDSFDVVFDSYKRAFGIPVDATYSPENFEALLTDLETDHETAVYEAVGATDEESYATKKWLLDPITGTIFDEENDYTGFDTFALPTELTFSGGDDAGVFDNDAEGQKLRSDLLVDFYEGNIDKNIYDARIIDCGITLDAWWPAEVKAAMVGTFGKEVRDDIYVIADLGPDATTAASATSAAATLIAGVSSTYGMVSINYHNGKTRDRARNIRTSGNYEIAKSLPKLYRTRGAFTVHAGYLSGRVEYMDFEYFPKIYKNDSEIKPLKKQKLRFAMQLDRSGDLFYMSDSSQYNTDFSVLGSERNLIFAGDVMRTFKKVMAKYAFHPENFEGAKRDATTELNTILSTSWFPASIPVSFEIFQTRNDKINKTATVDVGITFPDVVETWKVTITANRQPLV